MALENIQIQEKLADTFGENAFDFRQEKDVFSFEVMADQIISVILFLKNDADLRFHFLTMMSIINLRWCIICTIGMKTKELKSKLLSMAIILR